MIRGINYKKRIEMQVVIESLLGIGEVYRNDGIIDDFDCELKGQNVDCKVKSISAPGLATLNLFTDLSECTPMGTQKITAKEGESFQFQTAMMIHGDNQVKMWICTLYGVCKPFLATMADYEGDYGPEHVHSEHGFAVDAGGIFSTIGGVFKGIWDAVTNPFGSIFSTITLVVLVVCAFYVYKFISNRKQSNAGSPTVILSSNKENESSSKGNESRYKGNEKQSLAAKMKSKYLAMKMKSKLFGSKNRVDNSIDRVEDNDDENDTDDQIDENDGNDGNDQIDQIDENDSDDDEKDSLV